LRIALWASLLAALLCAGTGAVHADFATGMRAVELRLYDEAFLHFLPAAREGNSTAQLYVANMYRRGYGVKRDMTLAARWYRRAAEQNEPSGMYNYGVHLRDGAGVTPDQKAATQWFEKAAQRGHTAAMFNLGLRISHGKGAGRDPVLGYAWVQKAAGKGSIPAIRRRPSLENNLSEEQIRRGREMARNLPGTTARQ
jgi:TPR repeat protein